MLVFLLILNILYNTNSAVCQFAETVKVQGDVLKEHGYFYFKRGEGIRWDYIGQEKKIFLLARGKMWEYHPKEGFFRTYEIRRSFWELLQDPGKWKDIVKEVQGKNGKFFVKLKGGEEILMEVKKNRIRKISFEDTSFEFHNCRYNISLPSSLFNPTFLSRVRKK